MPQVGVEAVLLPQSRARSLKSQQGHAEGALRRSWGALLSSGTASVERSFGIFLRRGALATVSCVFWDATALPTTITASVVRFCSAEAAPTTMSSAETARCSFTVWAFWHSRPKHTHHKTSKPCHHDCESFSLRRNPSVAPWLQAHKTDYLSPKAPHS